MSRRERPERQPGPIMWECRICEVETGVKSAATTKIRKGGYVNLKTGRMAGGTFFEVCAMCLARGRYTIVSKA